MSSFNLSSPPIIFGSGDPTLVAVNAPSGWMYQSSAGKLYIKQDNGNTTNWLRLQSGSDGVTFIKRTIDTAIEVMSNYTMLERNPEINIGGSVALDSGGELYIL